MPQVIKKRRIVLASVLKPVDDTRMFEKIGVTLAGSGAYEVTIIGYPSIETPVYPNIEFLSLSVFKRLSLKRLFAPWTVFKKINQVKPELIIINTPELLLVAILNRIFFGRKIIYDVRENYYQNIRFTPTFPLLIRPILAVMVRVIEVVSSPLVSAFFLAEMGYQHELSFARHALIIQNKLPRFVATKFAHREVRGYSKLIFSGTLATSTGVLEAIRHSKQLHSVNAAFSLTIIGYCALPKVLVEIKKEISDASFITLIGGDSLVPHARILEELCKADIGIIIYPDNPSTKSSIPTKLYEYLALQLPILIRHNAASHQLVQDCHAGMIVNEDPHYSTLAEQLKTNRFSPHVQDSLFWESEAHNIINTLNLL